MSPHYRLLARSPFITRALLITLLLSASVTVAMFAVVSASGPRNSVAKTVSGPAAITPAASGTRVNTFAPTVTTVTAGPDVDAANNDYRRIQNALNAAASGDTIMLSGTFDFTQPFAAAAWALGNDNTNGTADDYEVLVPAGVNNVTITASSLGVATIQGPGDLAAINLEAFLVFDSSLSGASQGWTISNLRVQDFDLSIGMFAVGVSDFNNTHLTNNYIRIARDLNATVAPADVNQNIGIHFSFGANQLISGNTIEIQGDGVSNGSNFATDVGMQSNTSGGNVYDGLQITNNIIRVLNAQDATNPQVILGIWENAQGHTSNITVSGNQFINQAVGNNPATNLQRGFRVTSHSSSTTTVAYQNNTVTGANIAFQWLAGSNFAGNQPVKLTSNTITGNATGVLVQSQGLANLSFNRIVGNTVTGLNNVDGIVTAENNWWGCNAGPGNAGCDAVTGVADFNPWLVLRISASPSTIGEGGTSTVTADMTHNSDNAVPSATIFVPPTSVSFDGTPDNIFPVTGTLSSGQASSTFTSLSASNGTASATVDNQTVSTNITVVPMVVTITPATSPTAVDNDYTRINNVIQSCFAGQTIILNGTFNWTEPNAAASWAKGSDGVASTADDYSILVPANRNSVTLTANNLGDATIQGPGDLPAVNLEGVLVFDGGDNQNWTISNLRILDFDLSIAFFSGAGGTDAFNSTLIANNYIRIARDLNATVAPADVNQNIGIHFSFGMFQTITGNTIDIQGDGVSNGSNFATDVGMQSNTSGGDVYDGLQITNNTIRVLNAQSANPEVILGIWENTSGHTSNITVSGNQFINQAAGNNPATNLQRGFRVTSHSSPTTTVTYQDNTVKGANIGFQWLAGSNFAGNQPVQLTSNTITGGGTGVLVQSQGLANLSFNRIVGNTVSGLNNVDGIVTAENNWWGCNAGPGNAGCDAVTGVADFNPWLVLRISASPGTVIPGGTSTATADMTHNSDNAVPSATIFVPPTGVTFGSTQGTMAPPTGTLNSGQATSTFTSTSASNGSASATVDNQTVSTAITVSAPPTFTIDDVTHGEGNSGTTAYTFTVTKAGSTALNAKVDYATVNGTATAPSDFTAIPATTLTFLPADTTKQFTVLVNGDTAFEANEAFTVHLSNPVNATISDADGTGTITNDDPVGGIISFSSTTYNTTESSGSTTITVQRAGDTTQPVTVDYATPDDSAATSVTPCSTINGLALPRCDYTTAVGTLKFAAGEGSKTFTVLISQDNYVEGPELLTLTLSNPTGGAVFGVPTTATLNIVDDASEPAANPIDDANNFVRQHYHDFLNREPDASGLAFWTSEITSCGANAQCIASKRINVSAAFFLSIEFQNTGYLVERLYKSSYGDATGTSTIGGAHSLAVPIVRFSESLPDTQTIGQGLVVGQTGWETVLENNKQAFVAGFVQRSRFTTAYANTLTPAQFVDLLFANAGVVPTPAERQAAIDEFGGAGTSVNAAARGRALRRVAENGTLSQQEFNRAVVLMQYFGYLRRNPNSAPDSDYSGYDFWLTKLNSFTQPGDDVLVRIQKAEMVKAFIISGEYRTRFGTP